MEIDLDMGQALEPEIEPWDGHTYSGQARGRNGAWDSKLPLCLQLTAPTRMGYATP